MNKNELREKYKEESGIDLNKLSGHPVWGYVQWLENVVNDCNKAAVMRRSEQLICRKCKSKLTDFDIYHNTCFKCHEVIKTN